jgi:hypothetical protein
MSQQLQTHNGQAPVTIPEARPAPVPYQEPEAGGGWVFFAAVMMVIGGCFGALQGLAAIIKSGYYVVPQDYFISVNATGWGWTHLILGAVVVLAGFALFRGAMWARILGILIASVSMIVNFAFIPVYPFWAMLVIGIDALVIWALAAHGRVLAE